MNAVPRVTVGLPVYNGQKYLAESLDALLGQSYGEFDLIISDNASTDATEAICREYLAKDPRIKYLRQPVNIGATPNHNYVFEQSHSELFKWASYDDLYGKDLLKSCIEALDEDPHLVLAHAYQAIIDAAGDIVLEVEYPLDTASPNAPDRFRSLLFDVGGDDFYGVMRSDILRRTPLNGSYHHSDRTIMAELALYGRFHQVPEQLFFRRDHPDRAERATPTIRARSANMEPRRASRLLNPTVRLVGEYVKGFVGGIRRAPLSSADRRECYGHLTRWLANRAVHRSTARIEDTVPQQGAQR
jgi:glycosyltransferase involved in cell wall biosynthesis